MILLAGLVVAHLVGQECAHRFPIPSRTSLLEVADRPLLRVHAAIL
jgi:hypothetical protein